MSSGDFAEELRQSVQDQLALIASAARAAKTRIGDGIAQSSASAPHVAPPSMGMEPPPDLDFGTPAPAVNFFADEPVHHDAPGGGDPLFEQAMGGGSNGVPDAPISFDNFAEPGFDDEGIPVWEEPP